MQDTTTENNTCVNSGAGSSDSEQDHKHGKNSWCSDLNSWSCGVHVILCDGAGTSPKHILRRDFPNKSTRDLHGYMRSLLLDLQHSGYLLTSPGVGLNGTCRRVWELCYRVFHLLGVCLPQGPRD